jgi:hypothetical protein
VLVWCRFDATGAVAARLRAEVGDWAEVMRVPFTGAGATVSSL